MSNLIYNPARGLVAVGSGNIQSGMVMSGQLADASVVSGSIGSGQISTFKIASGGLGSGAVGSGVIGDAHLASGSVRSGHVASGQLFTDHLASGATAMHAGEVTCFYSGGLMAIRTEEPISGVRAVAISLSGNLRIAMASIAARMPAVGVVQENVASGQFATVHMIGPLQLSSGLIDNSGVLGNRMWVGRSGQISTYTKSWNSGGFLSGDLGQPIGYALNSGAVLFCVQPVLWSGGALGLVNFG